jgi:hypothetical protein
MGIFSSSLKRNPSVPPSDAAASPTLLTGSDPNLVRVSGGGDPAPPSDDVQVARQRPGPAASQLSPLEKQQTAQPGRGYGIVPIGRIEQGMTPLQRSINRNQAFV